MNTTDPRDDETLRAEATRWVVRRDRGLSATETQELLRWLAESPRHPAAMESCSRTWALMVGSAQPTHASLERIDRGRRRRKFASWTIAVAAAVAVLIWQRPAITDATTGGEVSPSHTVRRVNLSDGSSVELNAGAVLRSEFTPSERRVLLVKGEANFTVAKDLSRAFVVQAGHTRVRAVGTVFNVRLGAVDVEVLVSEGKVRVDATKPGAAEPVPASRETVESSQLLIAGQRAVVPRPSTGRTPEIEISKIAPAAMAQALSWQYSLMTLGGATLAELAAQFEANTGQSLVIADPELAKMRIGGRFPANDVSGFVRVLENNYGVVAHRRGDALVLTRK